MKSKMNKSLRMFLALCLLVQLVMPAMVWESKAAGTQGTIVYDTGSNLAQYEAKFSIYKLLDGLDPSYTVENLHREALISALNTVMSKSLTVSSSNDELIAVLTELEKETNNSKNQQFAYTLASVVTEAADATMTGRTADTGDFDASGIGTKELDYGYYLIVDDSSGSTVFGSFPPVLYIVHDGTLADIEPKGDLPTFDKEIFHNEVGNYAVDPFALLPEDTSWDKVGDNQIGEEVYFRVNATLPTALDDTFKTAEYHLLLEDSMLATEFEYDGNYIITIGTAVYDETTNPLSSVSDIALTIQDATNPRADNTVGWDLLFDLTSDSALLGSEVTIEYYAVLAQTANTGNTPNENTVILTYSKSGDSSWDGDISNSTTTNTETDDRTVYDYTFTLDITKISDSSATVEDAEFNLLDEDLNIMDFTLETNGKYYVGGSTTTTTLTTDATGLISIVGLDDAKVYTLKEVKPLTNHVIVDKEISFEITVAYDENSWQITDFESEVITTENPTGETVDLLSEETDGVDTTAGLTISDYTHVSVTEGAINATVLNVSNVGLPETGGMGTVIFYVVGIGMMAGAGFLVYRRKTQG